MAICNNKKCSLGECEQPETCTAYVPVITNADRIRKMSDFELAKEIENAQSGIEIKNPKNIDYFDCILEWLQQRQTDRRSASFTSRRR